MEAARTRTPAPGPVAAVVRKRKSYHIRCLQSLKEKFREAADRPGVPAEKVRRFWIWEYT